MKRKTFLLGALGLVLAFQVKAAQRHKLLNVTFECDLPLSAPEKAGLDAARVSGEGFEVLVCEVGKSAFSAMQKANTRPYEYARSTYLGISQDAKEKGSRTFVQGPQPSEIWPESFPHKEYLEVFWLERKEGAGLMLAFRVAPSLERARAEAAIDQICATLQWNA